MNRKIIFLILTSLLLAIPSISLSQEVTGVKGTGQVKIGGNLEIPKEKEVDSAVVVGSALLILDMLRPRREPART